MTDKDETTKQARNTKQEAPKATQWGVRDVSCPPMQERVHTPVVGYDYPLNNREHTPMPEGHARKFLIDPSFEVVDETGKVVPPLDSSSKLAAGAEIPTLEPDQTVANFEELQTDALIARAAMRGGGERFSKKSSREELIDFLVGAGKRQRQKVEQELGDDLVEEMDDNEVDNMFEDA